MGLSLVGFAQSQAQYNVTAGNGNGVRFWSSDNYKIHMGSTSSYKYGPVNDYSIKMNMNNDSDRGWTWGILNQAPSAALNTQGQMQIKGYFRTMSYLDVGGARNSLAEKQGINTLSTSYTNLNFAAKTHSGSHAILFNAYTPATQVTGSLKTVGNSKYANNVGNYSGGAGAIMFFGNGGTMDFLISPSSTGKDQSVDWGTPKMRISRNGAVGIGTTNTTGYRLSVNGKVRAKEVKVETGWADFVFEDDYQLRTLNQVEQYINENGHLPDIPSAEEVAANGVDVGAMESKLLQKIEELTLYVIQQQKEIEALKQQLGQQQR